MTKVNCKFDCVKITHFNKPIMIDNETLDDIERAVLNSIYECLKAIKILRKSDFFINARYMQMNEDDFGEVLESLHKKEILDVTKGIPGYFVLNGERS